MRNSPQTPTASRKLRTVLTFCYALPVIFILAVFGYMAWSRLSHQGLPVRHISSKPFALVPIKDLTANLFTQGDEMRASGNDLFIEFRDAQSNLVDVGTVTFEMALKMPDMVMHTIGKVFRTATPGQYRTTVVPQMAGTWTGTIGYSGARGNAETNFSATVK